MRSVRFGLLLCLLLFNVSLWAQEPASSQRFAAPIPAPKDPQAVSRLFSRGADRVSDSGFMLVSFLC